MSRLPIRHVRRRAGQDGGPAPDGYDEFCAVLRARVRETEERAARQVNAELVRLYWQAGREVLVRKRRHDWNLRDTERVAAKVRRELEPLRRLTRELSGDVGRGNSCVDSERVAEVIQELKALHATFDGATEETLPDRLRINGFHAYDLSVRDLLDALKAHDG